MSDFRGPRQGKGLDHRRAGTRGRDARVRGHAGVEALEGRTLLATLDIASGPTGTVLTYIADPQIPATNTLTIQVANTVGPSPSRNYIFNDATDPITLGRGALQFGWRVIDANTVTGP